MVSVIARVRLGRWYCRGGVEDEDDDEDDDASELRRPCRLEELSAFGSSSSSTTSTVASPEGMKIESAASHYTVSAPFSKSSLLCQRLDLLPCSARRFTSLPLSPSSSSPP